jgi:hypothetical protein
MSTSSGRTTISSPHGGPSNATTAGGSLGISVASMPSHATVAATTMPTKVRWRRLSVAGMR